MPDWICEILSPSNARHDRVTKTRLYRDYGVGHYWIADVEVRVLEALTLDAERTWVLTGTCGDETAAIPPFDAIVLDVSRLFSPTPPAG